jgi:UDP-2,3-diacylglucosamine pyrophosphatase LpxH
MSSPSQRFQLVSDLHLEFYRDKPERLAALIQAIAASPHAPYLLVAGDLGYPFEASYHDALAAWSRAFEHVCVIAGNHEFYCLPGTPRRSYATILAQARTVCAYFPNVSFLHDSHVDLRLNSDAPAAADKSCSFVRVIGTPLWYTTKPSQMMTVMSGLNDYCCMWVDGPGEPDASTEQCLKPLRPHHVNAWHQAHVLYLWKAIEQARADDIPCIVMTHHLPSLKLIAPQYQGSPLNFAFATPLDDLVSRAPVCAIVCGHSHARASTALGERACPAYLNAAGYPHEGQVDAALRPNNCILDVMLQV